MKLLTPERVATELRPPEHAPATRHAGRARSFEVIVKEDGQGGDARWSELVEFLLEVDSRQ